MEYSPTAYRIRGGRQKHKYVIHVTAWVVLFTIAISPTTVLSQGVTTREISDSLQCLRCIERYLLTTIHDSLFPGEAIGDVVQEAHVNSDGTVLVASNNELFLANRAGAIIRQVGWTGDVAGEYVSPAYVSELPNEYLVIDNRNRRITRLSKDELSVLGTTKMPGSPQSEPAFFKHGGYAIRANVATRASVGLPLHMVSVDGIVQVSFGAGLATGGGRSPNVRPPTNLAVAGDGGLWAGYAERYRIEKWDDTGHLLSAFERSVDWFRPRDLELPAARRYATLTALHEDGLGRLWVHIRIRTATGDGTGFEADPELSESIIEVLDMRNSTVIASARFPGWRAFPASGGFYARDIGDRTTDSGLPLIKLYGFRLTAGIPETALTGDSSRR